MGPYSQRLEALISTNHNNGQGILLNGGQYLDGSWKGVNYQEVIVLNGRN